LFYYEIDVVEDDGDNRIWTGSTSNGIYAHAQKETLKNGGKWFTIIEIFDSYWKSGLLNQTALSELQPNTRRLPYVRMRTKMWRKNK